jgi:hypothetical protein
MHCVPSGNSREQGSKGQDPFDSPTKPSIVHCQAERQKAEPERSKHQPFVSREQLHTPHMAE